MKYAYVAEGFLNHNTSTSRLSSNNPNAQNFPRATEDPNDLHYEYGPKKLFTSRFGEDQGVIMQLDYCLAGDTLVELAGGGRMEICEIVERVQKGEDIYVYSTNPETFETVVSRVERGALTFKAAPTMKLTLDNGETVIATPEHKFLKRSGEETMLKDLEPGDSMMGFREYDVRSGDQVYRAIGVDYDNRRKEHQIVAEYFHGPRPEGMATHHKDGNGLNNHPDNLEYLTQSEHFSHHLREYWGAMSPEERSERRRNDITPELREVFRENATQQWANYTPEERAEVARKISEAADNKGEKNPMYGRNHNEGTRDKIRQRQKAAQQRRSPEERKEASRRMRRAQIDKVAQAIIADGAKITSKNWKKYKGRSTPVWENAVEDLVFGGFMENHKVVSVEPWGPQDVYCIKVENFSNFALGAGIVSRNSQLELRLAAVFSEDEGLKSAYAQGKDLHIFVASRVFKIPEEQVTKTQRSSAKAVGFGQLTG